MTESRPRLGELISAGCALALLILLLATAWYGVAGVPDPTYARPAVSGTETGWDGLTDVRWVIVLTAIVAVGAVVAADLATRARPSDRLQPARDRARPALLGAVDLPGPDRAAVARQGARPEARGAARARLRARDRARRPRVDRRAAVAVRRRSATARAAGRRRGSPRLEPLRSRPRHRRMREPRRRQRRCRAASREPNAMSEPFARLRFSEWLAAAGAVALVVFLFALTWYSGPHPRTAGRRCRRCVGCCWWPPRSCRDRSLAQALAAGPALQRRARCRQRWW